MGLADIVAGANRAVRGHYRSPEATSMDEGVGDVDDAPLVAAARTNRLLALKRIRDAHWADLEPFQDATLSGAFYAGESVEEVHGDPDFGRQGPARQAYEVLAVCNELLRYGAGGDLHPFHRRLYAWALCFRVGNTEKFVVAANNFGLLRRLWPTAVFLERTLADRLDVPIAEEPGMEGYLTMLADKAWSDGGPRELGYGPSTASAPYPFRDPSTAVRHRRIADTLVIERRGLLTPAWASGMTRTKAYFDLKRWLPERSYWWTDYGPSMETPLAVSYEATWLTNAENAAWGIVYDQFFCFLLAAWVHWLVHEGLIC